MVRTAKEKTVKKHIHIFKEDDEFIQQHYGGADGLGYSKFIRSTLRAVVKQIRERMEGGVRPVTVDEKMIKRLAEEEEGG